MELMAGSRAGMWLSFRGRMLCLALGYDFYVLHAVTLSALSQV